MMGSGPVRGFAVTLGLGIACSIFTAVYVTHLIVGAWYDLRRPKPSPSERGSMRLRLVPRCHQHQFLPLYAVLAHRLDPGVVISCSGRSRSGA